MKQIAVPSLVLSCPPSTSLLWYTKPIHPRLGDRTLIPQIGALWAPVGALPATLRAGARGKYNRCLGIDSMLPSRRTALGGNWPFATLRSIWLYS